MEHMFVRVPVALKAKVTEDLKLKIIGELQTTIKNIGLDLEKFDFNAKQVLNQAANQQGPVEAIQTQIAAERQKLVSAKMEAEEKLKRAEALELGTEIGHGTLERTVQIEVGTDLEALMGAEILTEDGKIIAFRE